MVETKALGALLAAPFTFLLVADVQEQLLKFQLDIAAAILGGLTTTTEARLA